jgi:poly(3-hydroxybutyrate) depolymerase
VIRWLTCCCLIALAAILLADDRSNTARGARMPPAAPTPAYTIDGPDSFLYVPPNAARFQPVPVLVALHGMGGDGPTFCQGLLAAAERNGWIVLAPTFPYRDYKDPALVLQDDLTFLPRLTAMLDAIPARTGLATRGRALLYGFSRGGQSAQRYATFYPERVAGVATLAAGSYTLPLRAMPVDNRAVALALPYGVAGLRYRLGKDFDAAGFRAVPFWIAVGELDADAADTPRAWDPYLGTTRVDRARSYARTLRDIGARGSLAVYPGTGHTISPQMQADALRFLAAAAADGAGR